MARILITDDEEPIRTMMATALKNAGHQVVETRGAREAIELHRGKPVDLIITDLVMKEMDGTEMLRRIRAFSPATPVIAVSGARHGTMYLNMAKLLGADRILAKPFTPDVLLEIVNAVLMDTAQKSTSGSATSE